MSTNYFINVNPTSSSKKTFDKSISMVENLTQKDQEDMSYRPSELQNISRHLSESNITPTKNHYEDLVSCSVCFDVYDSVNQLKLPKILPCQHTYCVECIKNMMHISPDRNKFGCPQCKFEVQNLREAVDLPTSRIVLTLLEKDSLNYQGYASCPCCRQIRSLEVCFECNLPLCAQCVNKHFESWKNDITQNCLVAESTLENFKSRLDQLGTTENFENVENVQEQIEEAFALLYVRLNTEKELLLKAVKEIKDENAKYVNFKKEIVALIASFKNFRDSNETYEKKAMTGRMRRCQEQFEKIPKMEKEYVNLSSSTFKVLERFEKKPLPDMDYNFSGNLIVNHIRLDATQSPSIMTRQPSMNSLSSAPNQIAPSKPNRITIPKLEPLRETINHVRTLPDLTRNSSSRFESNMESLSKWMYTSQIKPQSEISITSSPYLMTSYENILFTIDPASNVSIFEKAYSVELKHKNSLKLSIPNIKCISANSSYLAVGYSGLRKEQLRGNLKNLNTSGIFLYRRDQHVICSVYEKAIDLGKNESFKSVSGIALTETCLYACDKDLRTIYKFDLKTGALIKTTSIRDGELTNMSINSSCLTVLDSVNSNLYLFDLDNLSQIKSANMGRIDQLNGQMMASISQDNVLFLKNAENQITLLDSGLEAQACFNEIQAKILSLSLVKDAQNEMLVVGAINSSKQFRLLGYAI